MSINDNLLNEIDELFGEESDKTATVNLDSSSDPEMVEMLETAGKEFEQLGGTAEAPETEKEPVATKEDASKTEVTSKEEPSKNEDSSKTEDASKNEVSSDGQMGLFPEDTGSKNACSAPAKNTSKTKKTSCSAASSTPPKPKEPDKDHERYVVLTNYNEQRSFPAEMTLEEIRVELEKEYPAYSKDNTSWYFEKQEDKNRYLCIPNYKSNKAG